MNREVKNVQSIAVEKKVLEFKKPGTNSYSCPPKKPSGEPFCHPPEKTALSLVREQFRRMIEDIKDFLDTELL